MGITALCSWSPVIQKGSSGRNYSRARVNRCTTGTSCIGMNKDTTSSKRLLLGTSQGRAALLDLLWYLEPV